MHSQHQPFICIKILCFYWLHIFNHEHKKENANAFSFSNFLHFNDIQESVRLLLFSCLCVLIKCFDAQADFSVCLIEINDFSFDFLSDA